VIETPSDPDGAFAFGFVRDVSRRTEDQNKMLDRLYSGVRRARRSFSVLPDGCIAEALVAQLREEATAHGVDVWTWLERQGQEGA